MRAARLFFKRQYVAISVPLIFAVLLPNILPGALGTFTPFIFGKIGVSGAVSLLYLAFAWYGVYAISAVIARSLIDKIGRMKIYLIGAAGEGIFALLSAVTVSYPIFLLVNFIFLAGLSVFFISVAFG